MKCLKILSTSKLNAESAIALTIKGIRQAVRNANAQQNRACPFYIIVPPSGVSYDLPAMIIAYVGTDIALRR